MHDALVRGFNINPRITLCQLFNYYSLHEKPGTGSKRLKQTLGPGFALSLPEALTAGSCSCTTHS